MKNDNYHSEEEDPLAGCRGLLWGVLLGATIWTLGGFTIYYFINR